MRIHHKIIFVIVITTLIGCSQVNQDERNNEINITGSGNLVTQEVNLAKFEQVEAGLHFDLTIRQGEEPHVVLTSDDNFIDFIQVEQSGSEIRFGFIPGHAYDISGVTLKAEVVTPEITRLDLDSASHAHIVGYRSQRPFEANLTGSSALTGEVRLDVLQVHAFGSSFVQLSGSATDLSLEACGANIVDLSEYKTVDAQLEVSCASKVILGAAEQLVGDASQHAQVFYSGKPALQQFKVQEFASLQSR